LAALVVAGVFVALNKDFAAVGFWILLISSAFNVLVSLLSDRDGIAVVREEMTPTDLPPSAKIPITLMSEAESETKR
jgi:hypothetical protein